LTLSEAVAIKRALKPLEKAAAKERLREAGCLGGKGSRNLPEASKGRATGMARRTLEKAEAIVDAAEAEPEKYGKLLADMDRTGRANAACWQREAVCRMRDRSCFSPRRTTIPAWKSRREGK
jgi:hypothetical protein